MLRKFGGALAIKDLRDLVILKKSNYIFSLLYVFSILNLAGLPPFIGFYGKTFILYDLVNDGRFIALAALMAFSVIAIFYYTRLAAIIFFDFSLYPAGLKAIGAVPVALLAGLSIISLIYVITPLSLFSYVV